MGIFTGIFRDQNETYKCLKIIIILLTLFHQNLLLISINNNNGMELHLLIIVALCSSIFAVIVIGIGMYNFLCENNSDPVDTGSHLT